MLRSFFFALLAAGVTTACITIELSPQIKIQELNVRVSVNDARSERKDEGNKRKNDMFGAEFELEFDGTVETGTSSLTFSLATEAGEAAARSLLAAEE